MDSSFSSSSSLTPSSPSPTNNCIDENGQPWFKSKVTRLISTTKEGIHPSRNEREKYYYFGRDHRKKFHYCGDCMYRAYHRKQLSNHVKKRHPSSTTALPPLKTPAPKKTRKSKRLKSLKNTYSDGSSKPRQNRGIAKLSCSLCGFRTNFHHKMRVHKERHRKKFDHQCTLCSFSAKRKRDVYSHVKNQHDKPAANQGQEWYYPPNGGERKRIQCCGECSFKTPYRMWLVKHVEKEHPLSTTALPTPVSRAKPSVLRCTECEYKTKEKRDFERHQLYHRDKSAFQCPWCSFSVDVGNKLARHVVQYHTKLDKTAPAVNNQSEPSTSTGSKENDSDEAEKWHYFPSGHRKRYKLCGDCNYKTTTNSNLDRHIKIVHPFSTTALKPKEIVPLRCSFGCDFETRNPAALLKHEACHRNKSAHKCRLCSYSTKSREILKGHLKRHHQGNRTVQNTMEPVVTNSAAPEETRDKSPSTTRSSLDRKPRIVYKESHRFRFISCGDCDYKAAYRFTLMRHVKRMHPFSSSALPPLSIKRKKTLRVQRPPEENGSEVNDDLQMEEPVVSPEPERTDEPEVQEVARVPASASNREEWYYPPHGKRRTRYIYCEDCDYRTTDRYYLNQHVKTIHPSSTTAIPAQPVKVVGPILQRCSECSYKTPHKRLFSEHEGYHRNKSEHQCHLCSFSADCKTQLTYHWNHHHREIEPGSFRKCSLCNFVADKEVSVKRHQVLHRIKSKFKCHLCSYSVKTNGNLMYHLKHHHSSGESSEKEDIDEESNAKRKRKDLYEEKEGVPWKPNAFECKFCEFTTFHASWMRSHDEGHQRDLKYKCNLCSYSSDFKGIVIRHQNQQHKKSITSSHSISVEGQDGSDLESNASANNSSVIEEVVPIKEDRYKCSICQYSTNESTNMKGHQKGHTRNGKFKCPYCSYSSNTQNSIAMHHKNGHHRNSKSDALPNNTPVPIQQVESPTISATDIRKQFGVKECRVNLRNIRSSSSQPTIRSALARVMNRRPESSPNLLVDIPPNEADQTIAEVEVKLENEEQDYFEQNDQGDTNHNLMERVDADAVEGEEMQLLRIRIKVMKEKARIANEEVKDTSSKQRDVQKKIRKMNERKAIVEYDLRSEQCNLIEMRLLALESNEEEESLSNIESIEKKVESLEDEMTELDNELHILNEEEKDLDEDLKYAEESHFGIIQVIEALQSELSTDN